MTSKKPRSISLKSKSSLKFIRSLFHYKSGKLYWKPRPRSHFGTNQSYSRWNNRYPGKPAGSFQKGYVKTAIFKVNYAVHRLIFFYHHGYVPAEIDHINGNRLDNRIQNLRPADKFRNKWNAKKHKDKSGIKGVMKKRKCLRSLYFCQPQALLSRDI